MSKRDRCDIPVSVTWLSTDQWRDLRIWLVEHVDDMDYIVAVGGNNDKRVLFYFAREKDAVLFALKWS